MRVEIAATCSDDHSVKIWEIAPPGCAICLTLIVTRYIALRLGIQTETNDCECVRETCLQVGDVVSNRTFTSRVSVSWSAVDEIALAW
jgi:hypothetical protein